MSESNENDDEAGVDLIFKTCFPFVYAIALRLTGEEALADAAAATVLTALYRQGFLHKNNGCVPRLIFPAIFDCMREFLCSTLSAEEAEGRINRERAGLLKALRLRDVPPTHSPGPDSPYAAVR